MYGVVEEDAGLTLPCINIVQIMRIVVVICGSYAQNL